MIRLSGRNGSGGFIGSSCGGNSGGVMMVAVVGVVRS